MPVVRLSKLSNTIRFAGIAFALGLIMMLGLVLILELMRAGRRSADDPAPEQEAFAWGAEPATVVPMSSAVSARVPSTPSPASAPTRDPWRASPSATAVLPVLGDNGHTDGNGHTNGNGHANGNGNRNGHTNGNGHTADVEVDPQRSEGGLLRRR